jgi:predicted nucleic acid-binding protein
VRKVYGAARCFERNSHHTTVDASNQGELMPVLVDTNILVDVLTDDARWADWSITQLETNAGSGLIINPVVYAELCFGSPSVEFVDDVVRRFALTYQEIPRKGLFRAAEAFARYKAKKDLPQNLWVDHEFSAYPRSTKRLDEA